MRDDSIRVSGPFEVIPGASTRKLEFETYACLCGRRHAFVVHVDWELMMAYPDLADYTITEAMMRLRQSVRDCTDVILVGELEL